MSVERIYFDKIKNLEAKVKTLTEENEEMQNAYSWSCREMDKLKSKVKELEDLVESHKGTGEMIQAELMKNKEIIQKVREVVNRDEVKTGYNAQDKITIIKEILGSEA